MPVNLLFFKIILTYTLLNIKHGEIKVGESKSIQTIFSLLPKICPSISLNETGILYI